MNRAIKVVLVALVAMAIIFALSSAAKKVIRNDVGAYTPRERIRADRWDPPKYFWTLEKEYEKLHPDIDIQFLEQIVGDHDNWLITQLVGGKAPEVSNQLFSEVNRHAYKGWYTDFLPYLEKPNPYVEGNQHWRDIFLDIVMDTGRAPDGRMYVLPVNITGTAIFYNKDIFKKVGVSVPTTWKEFMDIQAKIKSAGYIPFAFPMAGELMRSNWSLRTIQDMILDSKLAEIKGVKDAIIKRSYVEGGGVSQKELVRAIKRKTYSAKDPQWQEQLRLFKEWSQYWGEGFLSVDSDVMYRLFITGEASMMYESAARIKPVGVDPLRKFEYGLFDFPRITKESSPYATGIGSAAVGGATGLAYIVPKTTQERGLADDTMDWLMFVTAPQNFIPLANDLGAWAPALRAREGIDPRLEPFVKSLDRGVFRIESFYRGLTRDYADRFYKILQQYVSDKISLQEACDQIQVEMEKAADTLISEHPDWKVD
ncbi:MAG: ABC transporter substrate-binding protein [bacterium]